MTITSVGELCFHGLQIAHVQTSLVFNEMFPSMEYGKTLAYDVSWVSAIEKILSLWRHCPKYGSARAANECESRG